MSFYFRSPFKLSDFKLASANSLAHFAISQIRKLRCDSPQIAIRELLWLIRKSQIRKFRKKYCTTLSQNSPTSRLHKLLLCTNLSQSMKSMYLRICGSFKSAITKSFGSANRKAAKCHIFGRSANLTNYLRPKICGTYNICGPRTFA